jgi:hypothetical protein
MRFYFLLLLAIGLLNCTNNKNKVQDDFFIDQNWIEAHFNRNMDTKQLVDIREKLRPLGVLINYSVIQRDSQKRIIMLQMEVQDGKGKFARSRTEFLDEIPYGIRIHRNDYSDEGFKVGPLYTKRPE